MGPCLRVVTPLRAQASASVLVGQSLVILSRSAVSPALESLMVMGDRWFFVDDILRLEDRSRGETRTMEVTWSELTPSVRALCDSLLLSVFLHGHASPTHPRLLRLWCSTSPAQAPICNVFFGASVFSAPDSIHLLNKIECSSRPQEILCVLCTMPNSRRDSPPVSSLPIASNRQPLRSTTQPQGLPGFSLSAPVQPVCRHVSASGSRFKVPFFLANLSDHTCGSLLDCRI